MRLRSTVSLLVLSSIAAAQAPSLSDQLKFASPPPPPASPAPAIIPMDAPPPPKDWRGSVDFGLNGTSGNAEALNFRFFAEAKRERPDSIWLSNVLFNYANAASKVTQNQILANSRYEWLFANSPWSYFVSGGLQYDQFRAFDLLLFAHTGWGYAWYKDETGLLKTRFGVGGSQEIGGPNDKFNPEALLGLDYERQIFDRTKFVLSGVLYPDLGDWFEYRATVSACFEVVVNPEYNIGLKVGAIDNYISDPQGRKPNDLNYFMAVSWKY